MSKAKIMIIEDEYIVAMDIQMILENQGYEVTAIESAAETALEKAEKTRPDLALVDIALEGRMDGVQAAEQLRSRFNIPVVYLTAFADEIKLERAKKTEPFGYLIKPFKEEDLKSAIEIALFKNDMETKLRHSEERYRSLIESTEDAVYLIDREMRFLYANRRYLTRHGLSLKEIEGLEYAKCHSTERTKEFSQKVKQVFESDKSVTYEHESEKDKKIFLRTLSPVRDPRTEEINSIIVISKDITERKQAEEALKENENKYRELYDEAPVGYHEIDREGRITRINQTESALLGYAPEEMIGRYVWEFIVPDQRGISRKSIKTKIEQKKTGEGFERNYVCKNGKEIVAYIADRLILDKSGNLIGIRSTLENITERKRAEEALADEAVRRRILVEQSRDGIVVLDQDGKVYEANKRYAEMLGYTPEEVLQLYMWDWDTQWTREQLLEMVRNVDAAGDHFETRHRRKDGTFYDVEISTNGAVYKGKKLVFCVCRDITERKRAEEALRHEKEVLHTILDNIPVMVAFLDPDGHHKWVNKCWQSTLGWTLREALETDVLAEFYPDPEYRKYVVDFIGSAERIWSDFRTRIREGRVLDTLWANIPLSDGSNIGIGIDITKRKQAEEALRESEDKFRGLAESIKDVFFAMDRNLKYTYWNKASEELTGIPVQEALGKSIYEIFPEIRGTELEKFYLEVIEKQKFQIMENAFSLGGRDYVFQINAYPTINGLAVIAKDITASKQAEEALLKERNFVSAVLDTAPALVVVLNAQGRIVRFNLAAEQLTGYKFSEVEGKYYWDLFLPPEEAGKTKDAFFHLEPGKFPYKSEDYWLTKDGERRLISWSQSFLLDNQGWVEYFISTGIDVTERKRAEQRLLKSQKELRSLSKYLQDVREEERKRISREIHDELGQTLTALKIDLAMLAENIPEKQKNLLDQTKSITELIDIILNTVKKISSDLRPGLLDDFGLVPAIEWQAAEFTKRTGTKCLLSLPDEEIKIDQDHSTAIFRILQEALTNVTRHARATEVRISLGKTDREIRLTVKDNGIGIEEKDILSSSSLGLIGIRERAQFFKGKVNIRSERDKGTTLKVSIPYPKEGSR